MQFFIVSAMALPVRVSAHNATNTGALSIGCWNNNKGQAIHTGGSTAGRLHSGTWLRSYAPFQDLSAAVTCSGAAARPPPVAIANVFRADQAHKEY
jgi:hypothetical protein